MRILKKLISILLIIYILTIHISFGIISTTVVEQERLPDPGVNNLPSPLFIPSNYKDPIDIIKEFEEAIYPTRHAWDIARSMEGTRGDCYRIVKKFIKYYFNEDLDVDKLIKIEYNDLQPGDIIYYRNGGLNYTHWAIWLSNDMALHGNYNGSALIESAFPENASKPIFYRLGESGSNE